MSVNEVVYNGETLIDLKSDTVTPETLAEGVTAHAANGEKIVGTMSAADLIAHADIPAYVKSAALELAQKVKSVQTDDSITFLAMSDSHYYGAQGESGVDGYVDSNGVQTNESILHGAMAAKILAYAMNFDFMAHLGDATWGHKTTNSALLQSQIKGIFDLIREAHANIPCFHAIGNHDSGLYYHNQQIADGKTGVFTESGEYLFNTFTALSASDDTTFGGEEYGGYCYRDFADKKLRVFLLNTTERHVYDQTDYATLGSQRLWFASALTDLNSKSDADEWSIIVLSHYPADYGNTMPLSELLKAYVEGGSITISVEDGSSSTVSFAGANSAKFVAQFHGHVHNFVTSKLHSTATGSPVKFDAWRMCIPNGQYNRENYYTTVSGINFAEDTTYTKTAGTASDTAFVVNVVIPSKQIIHSFCYGAGYDRTIGYGATTYYSVTRDLVNVTTDNTDSHMEEGESYTEIITVNSGCDMNTITVTMGGVDVSGSVVDGSQASTGKYLINIPEVTGNIVITAKAQARPNFTNLVPLSINTDGTDYNVDGDGYDNDTYIASDGALAAKTGYTSTGFIPVTAGAKTIRVAGDGISVDTEYTRFAFYDSNFALVACFAHKKLGSNDYYPVEVDEAATVVTMQMDGTNDQGKAGVYMRVCTKGDGADLIVTVNEEITYGGSGSTGTVNYAVVQNLINAISSNAQATVTGGSSFSTTLTANSGYELGDVTVTMGGLDVTSSVYSSGQITISSVTGNIVITATANAVAASYTNQLPISTDTDGSVYNGVGYKANSYLSSGNVGTKSGYFVTGFIPAVAGDVLYFENVGGTSTNGYLRVAMYDSSKKYLSSRQYSPTTNAEYFTFGSDGNINTFTIAAGSYHANVAYVRICGPYMGADSIITVNEPIE